MAAWVVVGGRVDTGSVGAHTRGGATAKKSSVHKLSTHMKMYRFLQPKYTFF